MILSKYLLKFLNRKSAFNIKIFKNDNLDKLLNRLVFQINGESTKIGGATRLLEFQAIIIRNHFFILEIYKVKISIYLPIFKDCLKKGI